MTELNYRLPLDHPLWEKLYGPYGVENVSDILNGLLSNWDPEIAKDLFWEKLHHQETLYPVTYAAACWLNEIALKHSQSRTAIATFLGWVVYCGMRPRLADEFMQKSGMLLGLPTDLVELQHPWIPAPQKLLEPNLADIKKIETNFMVLVPKIKELIAKQLQMVSGEGQDVSYLAAGLAAIVGDFKLAGDLSRFYDREGATFCENCNNWHDYQLKDGRICLSDGWQMDRISPDDARGGAAAILAEIPENSVMAEFLCVISGWTVCPECGKSMKI